jgi:hypothetical protein
MNDTKKTINVHGLLASGTEEQLIDFHLASAMLLNFLERRGDTVHAICMDEQLEYATKLAEKTGVTLQEIESQDGDETYKMIVQGQHPGWQNMVQTARADTARSAFDGKWTINFTDCNGKTTIYKDCKVNNINDTFVTFTTAGRSREMKLPLTSICAMVIMERER